MTLWNYHNVVVPPRRGGRANRHIRFADDAAWAAAAIWPVGLGERKHMPAAWVCPDVRTETGPGIGVQADLGVDRPSAQPIVSCLQ